jgi:hypothetical protein
MPPKIVITNRVHPDVIELLQARCRIEVNLERDLRGNYRESQRCYWNDGIHDRLH